MVDSQTGQGLTRRPRGFEHAIQELCGEAAN